MQLPVSVWSSSEHPIRHDRIREHGVLANPTADLAHQ